MEEEYLAKYNLTYEDLRPDERQWLADMVKAQRESQLTLERLKQYVTNMRESVSNALENEPEYVYFLGVFKRENRNNLLLKARLRNYRLLLTVLTGTSRQTAEIDAALANIPAKPRKTWRPVGL